MRTATTLVIACFPLSLCLAQVTPTPLDLTVVGGRPRGVSAPSHDVVFCGIQQSGSNSKTFCRSTDAGASWSTVELPETAGRSCVSTHALTNDLVFASMTDLVGSEGGAVWRSTDGGDTWEQLTTTEFAGGFLNFTYFTTPDSGMAMGDPNGGYFEIHTTVDGGDTWVRTPEADMPAMLGGEFGLVHDFAASGDHVWFDTNEGRIFMSDDLGLHWTLSPIPAGAPTSANVTFADPLNGAAHHTLSYSPAYITHDGGASWTPQPIAPSAQVSYINAVPGVPGAFVFNAQGPPRVCATTDDFQTYSVLASTSGYAYGLMDIRMFDASIGWIPEFSTYEANAMYKVENALLGITDEGTGGSPLMQIFPNPASEGAVLVTLTLPDQAPGELRLSDELGRTLLTMDLGGTGPKRARVLDLHAFASGTYTVTFSTAKSRTTQRLMVQ